MLKRRTPTTPRTMPTWDGRPDTALAHLHDVEDFLKWAQRDVWRQAGATEEEITRVAPANDAQLAARFDQWRDEVRARLALSD